MKQRLFLILGLLFLSGFCFSQNIPEKIIGYIPSSSSTKLFQIQVGAFQSEQNAERTALQLDREGFMFTNEKHLDYTRVIISGIPANQVIRHLMKLRKMGFDEVIIREDSTRYTISEKWEITTPGSSYSSFEFNHDGNYIAVEDNTEEKDNRVYFGEYTMPARDTINLNNLGVLKIEGDNENDTSFSFSLHDEPEKEINFAAVKAEKMPESLELDLFCRTWKVINCTESDSVGLLLFISNAGTYFFTTPDGESNEISQWRWYNNKNEEFEYSHDNWQHYGRVKIVDLKRDHLELIDPGYFTSISGYSSAGMNYQWEFVPANK